MPGLSLHSLVGDLTVFEEAGSIVALEWGWGSEPAETALLLEAKRQLEAYFDRSRECFDLPLAPAGSAGYRRIWAALGEIAYGTTRSYGAVARTLSTSARAVGAACAANPLPILIPCHRVVGSDGRLVAYSGDGGIETKSRLLQLESARLAL